MNHIPKEAAIVLTAATAVVPVPMKGSRTVPLVPVNLRQSSTNLTGKVAGCLPRSNLVCLVSYGINQQLPLSLKFGLVLSRDLL